MTPSPKVAPLTWVVGSGGLLGSSVAAAWLRRGPVWEPGTRIPWGSDQAPAAMEEAVRAFCVASRGGPWQIAWCAGAGVTGSGAADLEREELVLRRFLEALATSGADLTQGALFLASSAGGVYAGAVGAPFSEYSSPAPLAPYGRAKLRLERLATAMTERTGLPVLLGRIANLYGPAQNLSKGQGLVSHICRAFLLGQPLSIFVPLTTVRDYIYAPDCGELVVDALDRLRREAASGGALAQTKVLASAQGVTIGFLLAEFRRIAKRSPQVVLGSSASSNHQAHDLRLRSRVWTDLDRRQLTPLPVGMSDVLRSTQVALQRARLL